MPSTISRDGLKSVLSQNDLVFPRQVVEPPDDAEAGVCDQEVGT